MVSTLASKTQVKQRREGLELGWVTSSVPTPPRTHQLEIELKDHITAGTRKVLLKGHICHIESNQKNSANKRECKQQAVGGHPGVMPRMWPGPQECKEVRAETLA